jgi:hypothetical protein
MKGDPPDGAQEVGPITASDGEGCGGFGEPGTYKRALILLKNRAAHMGGNYVQIMTIDAPHSENGCFDDRFTIRGMVYRLRTPPPAEPEVAQDEGQAACDPPCSPGYRCDGEACQPLCNPPCSAGQVCRQDRTCGAPTGGDAKSE